MTRLIVIAAPSGAGKTTLCDYLLRDFSQLKLSISTTTRAPRGKEVHGREYFFTDRKTFEASIQENKFAEWATVHGNYYGTSKAFIDEAFAQGFSVLLDIDVQGADSLKKAYPKECFRIFISPPSLQVLEQRLRNRRTDTEESIQRRLRNAQEEMNRSVDFDCVIVNNELNRAYTELKSLVQKLGVQ